MRVRLQARSQEGYRGGGPGTPQAIHGIVNTLSWLYRGFNFSESKIIVIYIKQYIHIA